MAIRPFPLLGLAYLAAVSSGLFADRFASHAHRHQAALMADTRGARTNFTDEKDAWVCAQKSLEELRKLEKAKRLCRSAVPAESLIRSLDFLKSALGASSPAEGARFDRAIQEARSYRETALQLDAEGAPGRQAALRKAIDVLPRPSP